MSDAPPIPPCIHCGFDLTGLPSDSVCPECGGERPKPEPGTSLQPAHAQVLAMDFRRAIIGLRLVVGACAGMWLWFVLMLFTAGAFRSMWFGKLELLLPFGAGMGAIMLGGGVVLIARHVGAMRLVLQTDGDDNQINRRLLLAAGVIAAVGCGCVALVSFVAATGDFRRIQPALEPELVVPVLLVTWCSLAIVMGYTLTFTLALHEKLNSHLRRARSLTFGAALSSMVFASFFMLFAHQYGTALLVIGLCLLPLPFFLARGLRQWRELQDRVQHIATQRD
ncbi:MAG TPA: hypothetical protein VK157_04640 [Phycisphaerales bacterium]|nr:hypothetical protein [Phycisphaerales bacterium]